MGRMMAVYFCLAVWGWRHWRPPVVPPQPAQADLFAPAEVP